MKKSLLFVLIFVIGTVVSNKISKNALKKATFAGGCFWCMEKPFEDLTGVKSVRVGYANGNGGNPTYENYAKKGFVEAIQIAYDSKLLSYDKLLDTFWKQIDPTDSGGQFVDRGSQYKSKIFYHDVEQKRLAEQSKEKLNKSGRYEKPIVTEIVPFKNFYKAEDYHQNYYKKHPYKYRFYRHNSGRDKFLKNIWSKDLKQKKDLKNKKTPTSELKKKLTSIQYDVTQRNKTEPPFKNEYWNNKEPGIYVDLVSGEPLFSSLDKYDSGTGWPSFSKPLEPKNIIEKKDKNWFVKRTEVRSKNANSHLGHVFNDGPKPKGLRYCINSASLRFVPVQNLEKEGYGQYTKLFQKNKK